jgi:hypothetical protein
LSTPRKKSVRKKKTPYDVRQMTLPVVSQRAGKLKARAADLGEELMEDEEETFHRPWRHRMYNAIIGLCFVPFAWVLTRALVGTFETMRHSSAGLPFYKTHDCVSLIAGACVWLVIFFGSLWLRGVPLFIRLYVFGHELMHAWIAGVFFKGRIKEFNVSADGGYIVTDKYNFIIALAPYLWPIYCIPVLAVWGVVGWFPEGLAYTGTFHGALGFTWMYHLSFTVWMLSKGQSDLLLPGRIFSLVLIYTVNVALLAAFVITMASEFTWAGFGHELWKATREFYLMVAGLVS